MSGRHSADAGRLDQVRDVTEMRDEEFEDESLDSDDAFDDEDEEQYGSVLNAIAARQRGTQRHNASDDDSDDADEDDDDDEWNDDSGAGGVLLSDLLRNNTKQDAAKQAEEERQRRKLVGMIVKERSGVKERTEIAGESEFNVTASNGSLSLADLMGTMAKDGKQSQLKSRLQKLSTGREKSLVEPVAPVVAARMDRRVAYEEQTDEVGRNFQAGVQRHRKMATVSFRGGKAKEGRTIASIAAIDPQTKLEMEVARLLAASGNADARDVMDAEAAELAKLPENETTMEAVEERQKHLQKMRHLMFYDEMKKKRTAKIKSKLYRKIRKKHNEALQEKQRQRLREIDPEMAKKLDEKDALERARLRVSLKHRTTSKWMKKNLKRQGGGTAKSRQALQSELKEREKLHSKIMSRPKSNLESSGHGSDSDDGDSDDGDDDSKLRDHVVGLITEVEHDKKAGGSEGGIMGMKFMQRSLQKRRESALEDAKQLLSELDGVDSNSAQAQGANKAAPGTSVTVEGGRRKFGGGASADDNSPRKRVAIDRSTEAQRLRSELQQGQQTASVELGTGTVTAVAGAINTTVTPQHSGDSEVSLFDATSATWDDDAQDGTQSPKAAAANTNANVNAEIGEEESNPWLSGNHSRRKRSTRTAASKNGGSDVDTESVNEVAEVVTRLSEKQQPAISANGSQNGEDQASIVARAFSNAGGFREAFEVDKQREVEATLPKEQKELSGWGSWTGMGARGPSKRKLAAQAAKKKQHEKKKQKMAAARADAKLPIVVINEKRDKKAAKYKVASVPYPFKTREQYERSLKRALGQEWNTLNTVKKSTRPEVLTRAGVVIAPLEKQKRRKRKNNKGSKF